MTRKAKIVSSSFILALVCGFLLNEYAPHALINVRLDKTGIAKLKSEPSPKSLLLESEIFKSLSLHIDDVEFLHNAFIVQSLVAPLVRFSNKGRYEPYVAKSWSTDGRNWTFQLHEDLTCEDGQKINSESFKDSLIRSLQRLPKDSIAETPFSKLSGIAKFIDADSVSDLGIRASSTELIFEFDQPVGKALLEYLAMTPFSFICAANFKGDKWATSTGFISSGPYRVEEFSVESDSCTLAKRSDWPLANKNSFDTVHIANDGLSQPITTSKIRMTYGMRSNQADLNLIREVPRALLALRLGIEPKRFFARKSNRRALQTAVFDVIANAPVPFDNYHRARSFFFSQITGHEVVPTVNEAPTTPNGILKIRGLPRGVRPEVDYYQEILFTALNQLNWKWQLTTTSLKSFESYKARDYDIAFDRSHVDATLDPDFIRILFKSDLGPGYQDPGGRIAKLVDDFDNGKLNYRDLLINFNSAIEDEAAIIPMFHRGFVWSLSADIDKKSVSPLMSILHYEELERFHDGKN